MLALFGGPSLFVEERVIGGKKLKERGSFFPYFPSIPLSVDNIKHACGFTTNVHLIT